MNLTDSLRASASAATMDALERAEQGLSDALLQAQAERDEALAAVRVRAEKLAALALCPGAAPAEAASAAEACHRMIADYGLRTVRI